MRLDGNVEELQPQPFELSMKPLLNQKKPEQALTDFAGHSIPQSMRLVAGVEELLGPDRELKPLCFHLPVQCIEGQEQI